MTAPLYARSKPVPSPRNTVGPVRLSAFLAAAAPVAPASAARPYPGPAPAPTPRRRERGLS